MNIDEKFYEKLIHRCLDYYKTSESSHFNEVPPPLKLKRALDLKLGDEGGEASDIEDFVDLVIKFSLNTGHKDYMNQLWSKVEYPSILGEFLSTVTNTSMYTYEVAPVYTLLEQEMISRLTQLIWEGHKSEGIMTSGGTASNLQAMLVARNKYFPEVKDKGNLGYGDSLPVVLCADNAHYSIKRAMNILGLGQDQLLEIKTDNRGIIRVEDLSQKITESKKAGQSPFMIISTAGSTVEGAYDDIKEIGEICKTEKLWFHIDGAYGGSLLLSKDHTNLLEGVELCDSFSWDFHKILGMNLTCAFLFVKEQGHLKSSLTSGNDAYLFHDDHSPDLGPKSLQCGRKPDITKLWITWLVEGKNGLGKRVDKMMANAKIFSNLVADHPGFDLLFEPQYVNICFRPKQGKVKQIRDIMKRSGKGMINYSTNSEGDFFRMVISRPDHSKDELELILSRIYKLSQEVDHE